MPPPLVAKRDPPEGHDATPQPDVVRRWTDRYLHQRLAQAVYQPYHRAVIESEIRVREAWRSPGMWALVVSVLALSLSIAAFVLGFMHGG